MYRLFFSLVCGGEELGLNMHSKVIPLNRDWELSSSGLGKGLNCGQLKSTKHKMAIRTSRGHW